MSILNTNKTKLELIKDERIKTQNRIKQLREELCQLESEEIKKVVKVSNLEKFTTDIHEEEIKDFIITLFDDKKYSDSYEYSKVIKHLDSHELVGAAIGNEKRYFGAFVITYCLLHLNMQCKDISKKFNKSRSWATYKAIEILVIRLKRYIDDNYSSHISHYKEMYDISSYSHSNAIKLSS
jgi:hypothetical protein